MAVLDSDFAELDCRRLFESCPHPYLVLSANADFTIVAVNDRYLAVTNTERANILGRALFQIFPDDPNAANVTGVSDLHASLLRVINDKTQDVMGVQKYDIPVPNGNGAFQTKYWSPVNTPVFAPDGSVILIIHHVEDITEYVLSRDVARNFDRPQSQLDRMEAEILRRAADVKEANRQIKQTEAALRQSHNQFSSIFAIAPYGMALLSPEGRWLLVNPALCETLGYSEQEFYAMSFQDITYPDDLDADLVYVEQLLSGQIDTCQFEKRYFHKNGEVRWVLLAVSVLRDDQNAPIHFIAHIKDITDRKLAQDQLMASEREFRLLAETMPQIVWITRADGWNVYFNHQWVDYTGLTLEESYGHGWQLPFHPDDRMRAWDAWQHAVNTVGTYSLEARLRRADGEYRWWLVRGTPMLNDKGEVEQWFGTCTDIQQIKQAEEHEAAKLVAERASLAKSEFLAHMSHEIRTPMNAIIGFTRSLLRNETSPKQVERLKKIDEASNYLLHIINDILDMSKIEAGKMTLSPVNFSLNHLLSAVVSQISYVAEAKGIGLETDLSPLLPDLLYGDSLRISQCLINYAANAVKFTRTGTVTFRTALIEDDTPGLLIRFSVEDTGIGIAPEAVERLFNSFEQADKTITRQFGGTGLGLVLTKQLAEMMGGTVGVDSTPGKGSRFWFTARLSPAVGVESDETKPEAVDNAEERLSRSYANARLLAVEDMALNREILADMLEDAGLKADFAENGEVAVTMAAATRYDVILMDMQMPIMDGLSATKIIRTFPGYDRTPIVALTANAFSDDRQACLDAGMNDLLSKPFMPEELYQTLLGMLERNKPSAPSPVQSVETAIYQSTSVDLGRQLENELKIGIASNQFFLLYQAQVASNRVIGAEALIRWQHPERGNVSPVEFIPLAEETGLILPLGRWVLETACNQIAAWSSDPEMSQVSLSVNVSALQFLQADFVEQVLEILENTAADPNKLKLELTESMLVNDVEDIIAKMKTLRSHGVRFSMDDFGTGYSSLTYLKRLPLSQLKIDRSFITDILIDPNDATIARTIIALGQNLGMKVIAEGVETDEQRKFLIRHGCRTYQGYLFSKPVPAQEFAYQVRLNGVQPHQPQSTDLTSEILSQKFYGVRLLSAEDVPLKREIIADMLEEVGLKADFAENGKIAVQMAASNTYDLILMDIQMPVMDGRSATSAIRSLAGYENTPIIALTAYTDQDDLQSCFAAGVNDFVAKPIAPDLLYDTLLKWLDHGQRNASNSAERLPALGTREEVFNLMQDYLGDVDDIDLNRISVASSKPVRTIDYFHSFRTNFADTIQNFRKLLAEGNFEDARRVVHSLKGTSGQLGIIGIQKLAMELESAIKSRNDDADLLGMAAELEMRLEKTCAAIEKLPSFVPHC